MRFLLFIALALLPLSTALKCYQGTGLNQGSTIIDRERSASGCEQSERFCYFKDKSIIDSEQRRLTWRCDNTTTCREEGCYEHVMGKTMTENVCCCSTDLCNESPATAINSISGPAPSISALESRISDLASSIKDLASAIKGPAPSSSGPAPSNNSIGAPL